VREDFANIAKEPSEGTSGNACASRAWKGNGQQLAGLSLPIPLHGTQHFAMKAAGAPNPNWLNADC